MVFGTFDGLHPGHLHFFRQAKKIMKNSFLIVSIARDRNVLRIKGVLPSLNEKKRMALIEKCGLADKVILAGKTKYLPHILKEHPEIIALGYDQRAYVLELKKTLKNKDIPIRIVRLKPFKKHIYKNHLLKK
jgi:FAD synthetase